MKRLVISLDTGFDGCKIVVNEQLFREPFVVEDITDVVNQYPMNIKNKDYIRYEKDGRVYLVGQMARKSLQEADHRARAGSELDTFYTTGRFGTNLFRAGLEAFLGYALCRYEEYTNENKGTEKFSIEDIKNWDIHVGTALPHQFMDEIWKTNVKGYLVGHHEFNLYIGGRTISFNFDLKEDNCVYNSQAICALIDKVTDDKGSMIENDKTIYDYLPALIIDAGYKTVGKFKLARDGRMDKPESNMTYAMDNINNVVAAKVREKEPEFQSYMVEEMYFTGEEVYYEGENGLETFNIREMRDKETDEMAKKLMEYLMVEHRKLLDIKIILLAGGTGAAYYKTINEFCSKRANLKDKVWLADNGFNGDKCDPVFAIAIGMYKAMVNNLG